jgi:hypothetical protein
MSSVVVTPIPQVAYEAPALVDVANLAGQAARAPPRSTRVGARQGTTHRTYAAMIDPTTAPP